MTRAKERLIVSGSIDRERKADESTPIGWVLRQIAADEELAAAGADPVEIERNGARLVVRIDRHQADQWAAPAAEPEPLTVESQLALFAASEDGELRPAAPVLPPLVAPAEAPLHSPRRL